MARNSTLLAVILPFFFFQTLGATLNQIVWEESKPSKTYRKGDP